jgi:hypothetical protein
MNSSLDYIRRNNSGLSNSPNILSLNQTSSNFLPDLVIKDKLAFDQGSTLKTKKYK